MNEKWFFDLSLSELPKMVVTLVGVGFKAGSPEKPYSGPQGVNLPNKATGLAPYLRMFHYGGFPRYQPPQLINRSGFEITKKQPTEKINRLISLF